MIFDRSLAYSLLFSYYNDKASSWGCNALRICFTRGNARPRDTSRRAVNLGAVSRPLRNEIRNLRRDSGLVFPPSEADGFAAWGGVGGSCRVGVPR